MTSDFLAILYTTIQELQAATSADSVDVAYLGNMLRNAGRSWQVHGFGRLSEALERLQRERDVDLFRNEKGALQVRIPGDPSAPKPLFSLAQRKRFRPLQPPVWFAFTAALPSGQQRLLNRRTGAIWGEARTPSGTDWVRVVPVEEDEQRGWARQFVDETDISDKEVLVNAIETADWFRTFPISLDERRRRDWKPSAFGAHHRPCEVLGQR